MGEDRTMPDGTLTEEEKRKLVRMAYQQAEYAYAPYSKFRVGAALMAENGEIFLGSNVENASFGAGICAERNALFQAVSRGVTRFKAIAVASVADSQGGVCYPCGICLQALNEFCDGTLPVLLTEQEEAEIREVKLEELLPYGFSKNLLPFPLKCDKIT